MIFPLMGRRRLFSGSENFVFYDFFSGDHVDENVFAYSNSLGGEHGLILYHNRYATTSGWIRTSTAIAGKNDRGESILVQRTLGEALCCNPDGRFYYSFRDYSSGLEHLRSGSEICSKGLYAQLSGYEYRAYLDFRELRDDEFGSWGKLCAGLNGRGVASLAEEMKQVRYGVVIEAFRVTVGAAARYLVGSAEGAEEERLRSVIEGFYAELNRHTACSGDCRALAERTMKEIAAAYGLQGLNAVADVPESTPAAEAYADRLLLAAWLILHDAGSLAAAEEQQMVIVSWLGELGLERAFRELAGKASGETGASACGGEESALLLRATLRWQNFFGGWEMKDAFNRFTLLFADPGAREFLNCHAYEEHEWFNRERFDILLGWLVKVDTKSLAATFGPEKVDEIALLGKALHNLQAAAAEGGYRLDRFLDMLQAGSTGREPK